MDKLVRVQSSPGLYIDFLFFILYLFIYIIMRLFYYNFVDITNNIVGRKHYYMGMDLPR